MVLRFLPVCFLRLGVQDAIWTCTVITAFLSMNRKLCYILVFQ